MHLSVTQSSYELNITCTVLETFQFTDIVTCQLCLFAQAVILSRHQVYLSKELCVLENKFWLEFGVKGKVSHEHTVFIINMLTGIKLRKNGQPKRATCFAILLQNELKHYVARFTTNESNLRWKSAERESRATKGARRENIINCKRHDFLTRWVYYAFSGVGAPLTALPGVLFGFCTFLQCRSPCACGHKKQCEVELAFYCCRCCCCIKTPD